MNDIFSSAKIKPPRIQNILQRDRLTNNLLANHKKKLIVITGQAAQGKSTLAASFVKISAKPFAWINLGLEESNPVNLFRLIVQAVQNTFQEQDFSEIYRYIAIDFGPRIEERLYRGWVAALLDLLPAPIQIVLDGLERLSPNASSFRLVQVLIEETHTQMRFLILSRAEPPFDVRNLQIKQEASLILNEHLAFTPSETEAFFSALHNLHLSKTQIMKIHELTEGWVGGLLLLSEALKTTPNGVKQRLLSDKSVADFKNEAFRYLGDEIFEALSEQEKDLLIKSSNLEVIDPLSIKKLFRAVNPNKLLKDLAQKNLFIQSIHDPESGTIYRYHQLFREFLQNRLATNYSLKDQEKYFCKVGAVYEQNANLESALNCYIKGKSFHKASEILEHIGMTLIASGRVDDLADWLQQMPAGLFSKRPWLLFFLCTTRRFTAAMQNTHDLLRCSQDFEKLGDICGQLLSMAFLIEAYTLAGYHPTPITNVISKAEKLLEVAPKDQYIHESGMLWFQMGLAMTISCGNPRKAFWYCKKASLIGKQCGDINLQFSAMSHAVEALSWLGEFEMADKLIGKIESEMQSFSYEELQTYKMIAFASSAMLRGENHTAKQRIQRAYELVEKHGLIYWYGPTLATDLFITLYSKELEKAWALAAQMHDLAISFKNGIIEGISVFAKAQIFYRQNAWEKARHYIEKAMIKLSSDKCLTLYHYHAAVRLHSRIMLNFDDVPEPVAELQKTIDYLSSIPDHLNLAEAHLCMAFIKQKQQKIDDAVYHLEEGFRLADKMKYYQAPLLSRNDLADACVMVVTLNATEAIEYASYLLLTHLSDLSGQWLKSLECHSDRKVQAKMRQLRKKLYINSLPVIYIKNFGTFKVLRGDKPIGDNEWKRIQPKLLLKAIIARGGGQVQREELIEDLWPENDPRSGEKNFKVTLHRLRKALEPNLNKAYGSSYVHFKENQVSLDNRLIKSDVDEFIQAAMLGGEKESQDNIKDAIKCYTKSLGLYAGDFLTEDPYLSFAVIPRIEFRSTYIDLLMSLAGLYEKQGKAKSAIKIYKKAIQADPLMEPACQKLLSLYASCGMRNAAIETYQTFEKLLEKNLQCKPDILTQAIYQKISNTE